ncbi:AAA family ATPase [Luteimonas sp. A277]
MKLQRLRVEQFRKFTAPVEITGLEDGLNVFHGPNEAGKSTLAHALRTLFFEKHKTRGDFAATILPAGSDGAAPSLEADFHLGSEQCSVHKTFVHKPRARLVIADRSWDGDDADEELARRLGFELTGKGASRAETRGIPGLLWIEQGDSHSLATPLQHARSTLQERLQDIIGDIASSAGGRVAAAVEKELRTLLTRTGKPTGVLAVAINRLEAAREEQAQLQERADGYAALIDQLARDTDQFNQLESRKPWEEIQTRKKAAEEQLARLQPQARELEEKARALQEIRQRIEDTAAQRQTRSDRLEELRRQRAELEQAGAAIEGLAAQQAQAQSRHDATRAARKHAAAALRIAERQADRARLAADAQRFAAQVEQATGALAQAAAEAEAIAALRTSAAAIAIDDAVLEKLRKVEATLHENRIRREAIATRISWRLRPGHVVQATGQDDLEGEGQLLVGGPLTLGIDGVGEIDIVPGGQDVQRLAQEAENLEAERQRLLGQVGVASLAEADERRARHARILDDIRERERSRDVALGGQEEDHWRTTLAEAKGQADETARRLATLADTVADAGAVSLEDARRQLEDAEQETQAADSQLQACGQAVTAAQLQLGRLQAGVEAASRTLESPEARELDARQLARLESDSAQASRLGTEIEQLEAALKEQNPELLQADIDRFERSLTGLEHERSTLRDTITRTRSRVETLGVDGIDEKLAAATITAERLQRRHAQYQLRADALQLLHERIEASQRAVAERLYAPLRERLGHYLAILFPGVAADVEVEQLSPVGLVRAGSALALDEHSHGTREQLGVLARFAYADLLRQAGQPTLLVLDDALVHSDADRLGRMKRIVDDAASRHQILLFTCHPDAWRDAGANRFIDVGALG